MSVINDKPLPHDSSHECVGRDRCANKDTLKNTFLPDFVISTPVSTVH